MIKFDLFVKRPISYFYHLNARYYDPEGYGPTGNWDWGGVLVGVGTTAVGVIVLVACTASPAATVADISRAAPFLPGTYFKGRKVQPYDEGWM